MLVRRVADVEGRLHSLGPDWLQALVLVIFLTLAYGLRPADWLEPIVGVIGLIGLAYLWCREDEHPSAKRSTVTSARPASPPPRR